MLDTTNSYRLFSMKNPEAAVFLSYVEEIPNLDICETELHEINLKDSRKEEVRFLYDPKGAYDATFEWRRRFQLFKVDMLTVFGVGLGWEWMTLEPWLSADPKRELVFLEDDLSMLSRFLESPLAEKILSHPQTSVYYVDGEEIGKRVFELLAWTGYQKKTLTVSTKYYELYRPSICTMVDRKMQVAANELGGTLDEFYSFGHIQFKSFFRNILTFSRARLGSDLFGSFPNIPAIIVAAGPSLEGCLEDLRKVGDKAIIISGGTATNILLENGIRPHFCAAVDPNATQYLRLKQMQPFTIPLFYQSRLLPEGIRDYQGDLLYLRGGNGQPLIEWFDTAIGISGKIIDGGHSVSNMIVELAHRLGCSPIIMLGYDLSYPEGAMYPSSFKEALTPYERSKRQESYQGTHDVTSNSGSTVRTEDKWIVEALWISRYQQEHPHVNLYNASLSGMAISGIPSASFKELIERFLQHPYAVDGRVHRAIEEARAVPFSWEQISKALRALAQSIKTCEGYLVTLSHGPDPLANSELREQLAFRFFLSIYDKMFEKKLEMYRLFKEQEMQDPERKERIEKEMFQEHIHFLTTGLKEISKRICEFVGIAVYDGYFLEKSDAVRSLESLEAPNLTKKVV